MVKLYDKYLKVRINTDYAYIRADCLDRLRKSDAIIFDCDGVLIDVRESYIKATVETVKYFVNELMGTVISSDNGLRKIIYLFKRSGGFNNDWDIAYSILLFIFSRFPRMLQEKFVALVNSGKVNDMFDIFYYVKNGHVRTLSLESIWPKIERGLVKFVEKVDPSGIISVERELNVHSDLKRTTNQTYAAVKQFLNYPGNVGESLLTTVFEEIFCGPQLFEKVYGVKSRFYDGRGFIEKEKIILAPQSLDEIATRFGENNLGMATGRDYLLVKYTLGETLDRFNPKASIFLENVEEYERKAMDMGDRVNLKKPHPFSLLKAAEGLNSFQYAIYVGDSMEDILMVKRANEIRPHFISVGVYASSDFREELILDFLRAETDVILPSVNELPYLIRKVQEENL